MEQALEMAPPGLFQRDQGAELTSTDGLGRWEAAGLKSRMAGRGRALAHGFGERLWRTGQEAEG